MDNCLFIHMAKYLSFDIYTIQSTGQAVSSVHKCKYRNFSFVKIILEFEVCNSL